MIPKQLTEVLLMSLVRGEITVSELSDDKVRAVLRHIIYHHGDGIRKAEKQRKAQNG